MYVFHHLLDHSHTDILIQDLVKMLCWAYWGYYLPVLKRMEAKQHACCEAERKERERIAERDAAEWLWVHEINVSLHKQAVVQYKAANLAFTRVKGKRGCEMVGPYSVSYKEMLELEEAEHAGSSSKQ